MRQRILAATAEEINRWGVRFTMSDLATRLGVSKRTLYEHFSSKEEIIDALIVALLDDVRCQREEIVANSSMSFEEKLYQFINVRPKLFKSLGDRSGLEIQRYFPAVWQKVQQFINEEWIVAEKVLTDGVKQGSFRTVYVPLIIEILKGSVKEILKDDFLEKSNVTMKEMTSCLAEVLLYGIAQPSHTSKA